MKCPNCGSGAARKMFDGDDIVIYCPICANEENISKKNGENDSSDVRNDPPKSPPSLWDAIQWLIK